MRFFQLNSLAETEISILLTEVGIIPSIFTNTFNVCKAHREEVNYINKCRTQSPRCSVPDYLSSHQQGVRPRAERKITEVLLKNIHRQSGIIIPIRTPICSNCRKKLTKNADSEPILKDSNGDLEEREIFEEIKESPEDLDLDLELDTVENCDRNATFPVRQESQSQDFQISQSDTFASSQNENISQCSAEMESTHLDRLQTLNHFLKLSDMSPIKQKVKPFLDSGEKTKTKCISKAIECFSAICDVICPDDGNVLQDLAFQSTNVHLPTINETTQILLEIYRSADSWAFRRQILSILTNDHTYDELQKLLPGLTKWRYYVAKDHSDTLGCGVPVEQKNTLRNKIDEKQLDHFIDFITSSHIVKDLPFGMKSLKLSTGEVVNVPNLIRSLAPATIINHYTRICETEQFKPLGSSTLYKILDECAASVRKSIEGVDYYIAEGGRACEVLQSIVEKLEVSDDQKRDMKKRLTEANQYIKSDYKTHVQKDSEVEDHCRKYALCDLDKDFKSICTHDHDQASQQCSLVSAILLEIEQKAKDVSWDNVNDIMFQIENSVQSINEWKKHALRSRNQETARLELLDGLKEGQLLVTCDWAMKFLPRKYREGQTDWFAKRGLNWHITVTVHKQGKEIKTLTHVHLFSSQISQDGSVTCLVLCDVIKNLIQIVPSSKEIHMFSDNAGCYKNTLSLAMLKKEVGEYIKTYNFCEAQDGKGPCDRRAAHIKSCIKRYINEGHDVTTAYEMKMAIDKKQKSSYRVKVVDVITHLDAEKATVKAIPNISQMHNFAFETSGLRIWKAYGIGEGKHIPWDFFKDTNYALSLLTKEDWKEIPFQVFDDEVTEEDTVDVPRKKAKKSESSVNLVECSKEGCMRSFKNVSSLEEHLVLGNCQYQTNRNILLDNAKYIYGKKVNTMYQRGTSYALDCKTTHEEDSILDPGWAIRQKKKPEAPRSLSSLTWLPRRFFSNLPIGFYVRL